MAKLSYVRVSTKHQHTDRQVYTMPADIDKTFEEKVSAKDTNRPQLQALLEYMREGDVVYFESFSRIARSLPDLLNLLDTFAQKGVAWVSLKEQISTEGATGRLIVSVLGAISAYEREINAERREYGFRKALEAGTVGRPKAEVTPAFEKAYADWKAGKIKAVDAMRQSGTTKTTFYKLAKLLDAE